MSYPKWGEPTARAHEDIKKNALRIKPEGVASSA